MGIKKSWRSYIGGKFAANLVKIVESLALICLRGLLFFVV